MPVVIGVRFSPAAKIYYFDPSEVKDIRAGEHVVVETARGEEIGKVVIAPMQVSDQEVVGKLKRAHRRASALDLTQMSYHRYREQDALERCKDKVRSHDLPMKIVRAEYNYDGSRLVFFFAAEKRVDFRKLVQDLARSFKARIELRQIGVRDEAKLMGGLGRCGRALCCSTWLAEFSPVSIKMAKEQDLPLSPMEISGLCGRLLCCLAYENEYYTGIRKKLPKRGKVIDTPQGQGKVLQVNAIKETFQVELDNQVSVEISLEEMETMTEPRPQKPEPRRESSKPEQESPKSTHKSSRRRRRHRRQKS